MSGLEPFIASALASVGTAGATAGTAAAGTAAATTAATTAAATGAAAAGTAAAAGGAAAAGLTATEIIAGTSALASAAGAGAQLLAEPPKMNLPTTPTRDTARTEADQRAATLKRRGRAATLLTGAQGVTSNPTLGSPSLTGTA